MGDDGVEFCGISEENFSILETELKNMITAMKATVKAVSYTHLLRLTNSVDGKE